MNRPATREITQSALFAALIAVSSFVAIPTGSVPFTLQVFAVLLAGLALGARAGVVSVVVYLVLGLVLPVYAGGTSGIGVLLGPTGGYLIGFIPAAAVAGIAMRRSGLRYAVVPALLGLIPLYALGAGWLAWQLDIESFWAVLTAGVIPFVPFDVVKALLAAAVAGALVSLPLGLRELPRERRGRRSACREAAD